MIAETHQTLTTQVRVTQQTALYVVEKPYSSNIRRPPISSIQIAYTLFRPS